MNIYEVAAFPSDPAISGAMQAAADMVFRDIKAAYRIGSGVEPCLSLLSFEADSQEKAEAALSEEMFYSFGDDRIKLVGFYSDPLDIYDGEYVEFGFEVVDIANWIGLAFEMPRRFFTLSSDQIKWKPERKRIRIAIAPISIIPAAVQAFTPFLTDIETHFRIEGPFPYHR
jgi:hypothetical protein